MRDENIISHWHLLVDNFNMSSMDFYESVEGALRERAVPDLELSRVTHFESGIGSPQREYLRIYRRGLAFDVCAAPFGRGFFFSWWLVRTPGTAGGIALVGWLVASFLLGQILLPLGGPVFGSVALVATWFLAGFLVRNRMLPGEDTVLTMPIVGGLYERWFAPPTYYSHDTETMFLETAREVVQEMIGRARSAQGLRALSHEDYRPLMNKLFAK